MDDELAIEQRKERLKKWAQEKKVVRYLPYIILAFLMLVGYLIRIANLKHLMDVTTGKHIPLALDPFVFLRYAREILENGALSAVDTMRYHPWGYQQVGEFGLLSNVIVGFYKFIHLFNSSVTLEYIHVIYPPIFFSLSLIFFYLLVKRLFDYRVGLLATAFLVVLPSYLYRTLAGFSDKESLAMFFMFAAIYFYVRALQEDKLKFAIICGAIAGLASGLMGATWGGVQFLFIIFGMFALSGIFLDRFSKKDLWVYFSWIVTMLVVLNIFFSSRYNLFALIGDVLNSIMLLAFLAGIIYLLIKNKNIFGLKEKIRDKIPTGLFSIILSIVLGLIGIIVFECYGFGQTIFIVTEYLG